MIALDSFSTCGSAINQKKLILKKKVFYYEYETKYI